MSFPTAVPISDFPHYWRRIKLPFIDVFVRADCGVAMSESNCSLFCWKAGFYLRSRKRKKSTSSEATLFCQLSIFILILFFHWFFWYNSSVQNWFYICWFCICAGMYSTACLCKKQRADRKWAADHIVSICKPICPSVFLSQAVPARRVAWRARWSAVGAQRD